MPSEQNVGPWGQETARSQPDTHCVTGEFTAKHVLSLDSRDNAVFLDQALCGMSAQSAINVNAYTLGSAHVD